MPLLAAGGIIPPRPDDDDGGGVIPPPVLSEGFAAAQWVGPNGMAWLLTNDPLANGVVTLPGVAGIGAVPRNVTRRALSTGGTVGRWSHAEERLITWPVHVQQPNDPVGFTSLWRDLVRSFTSTTPPAGVPDPGLLRITRPDGTWREITAVYLDGLQQEDTEGQGHDSNQAVIQLAAFDPWWYGPTVTSVPFNYTLARAYVGTSGGSSGTDPYETVSPTQATGSQTLVVEGDVDALPTWTLTGPANSVTVAIAGASFTYNALLATGAQVIIDVGASTVQTAAGANVIGNLSWPTSTLFPLPPGRIDITVTIVGGAAGSGVQLDYRPRFEVS